MSPAGRPREFDESEVLLRALSAFWLKGYEATSLCDLIEATGLAKGSLYQAFGGKRSLFLQSLNGYLESARQTVRGILLAPFEGDSGRRPRARRGEVRERLRQVFLGSISYCQLGEISRGCFAVNCLSELAPRDPEVRSLLEHHYQVLERYLALALARIESGDAEEGDASPQLGKAKLLLVVLTGLLVMSKGPLDPMSAELVVSQTLDQLV